VNPPFSLVDRFGSRLAPLSPPQPVTGGFSGATVFRLACRDGTFALRGWPPSAEPARIRGLHRLLRHVAAHGVPVAVPLSDHRGETLLGHADRYWQIEPWLPGRADFRASPTDARLAAAMTTLAAFHNAAASFTPSPEEAEWFGGPAFGVPPTIAERRARMIRSVLGGELNIPAIRTPAAGADEFADLAARALRGFRRVGDTVLRDLRAFETVPVPLLPCLRDVWHDHVLFTGDAVTGLIDPAACRRDTVATDLSRLLGSLLGDNPPRWDFAIAQYVRRPLTPDEAALIPVLDRTGVLLSAATWLRRRYLLNDPCETPEVLARLRETVERIDQM
jgi:Ser/Thr protein kinase RdoA (MazF antagonist)